jgi:hypothetical protein
MLSRDGDKMKLRQGIPQVCGKLKWKEATRPGTSICCGFEGAFIAPTQGPRADVLSKQEGSGMVNSAP